jgi:hypothetical protein
MRFVDMMGRNFLSMYSIRPIQFLVAVVFVCGVSRALDAQDHEHQHAAPIAATAAWTWTTDANVLFGYNYQQRLFANFWAWESQNWAMGTGERAIGPGRLTLHGMLSLEPFTMAKLGSPQVFQTGESYRGSPLVNYQHPHDLFMGLGATYRVDRGRVTYTVGADLVGSPALGPPVFMHRESARDDPQAPLTHHFLDSTHVTPGVLRAGVEAGPFMIEASAFRGEEPDEDRIGFDRPRIDSWSARVSWRQGPWHAQFSGGHLHEPEWYDPYDKTRLTASIGFAGRVGSRPLNATLAWGENRELLVGPLDGYLFEWDLRAAERSSIYGRAERVRKEILSLGIHPRGLVPGLHPHRLSDVNALTIGHVWDLPIPLAGRVGAGADITVYRTSDDLESYFGSPRSFHVFLRWRPYHTPSSHIH